MLETDGEESSPQLVEHGDLLQALRDEPKRKPTLATELDVSPETVYRKARQLSECGLLRRSDGGYRLTAVGLLHAQLGADVRAISERIHDGRRLLDEVPEDALPPYTVFRGATVRYSDPVAPTYLDDPDEAFLVESEGLDGMIAAAVPGFFSALAGRASGGCSETNVLLPDEVARHVERNHPEKYERLREWGGVAVSDLNDGVPYSLFVAGDDPDSMLLVAHGGMGGICGVLQNDTATAVDWAERTVRSYRDRAGELG